MRAEPLIFVCMLALSGCQIASSTHGGNSPVHPARSSVEQWPVAPRTLSIAEQIAPPPLAANVDLGEPVPVHQPFVNARSKPKEIRVASLRGDGGYEGLLAGGTRELPMLAPLPVIDLASIRSALTAAVQEDATPEGAATNGGPVLSDRAIAPSRTTGLY